MEIKKFATGPLGVNTYVVTKNGKDGVLIDVGGADKRLLEYIKEKGLNITDILLTHGHFDHVGGVTQLKEMTGAKVHIHEYDAELTVSRDKSLASWVPDKFFTPFEADDKFIDDDIIKCGELEFKVMHCPGHTRGSSCFICEDVIFCGDAIFKGSVGRSDVYGSDPVIQRAALAQFKELRFNYKLLCGHGEETELEYELKTNPFLLDLF